MWIINKIMGQEVNFISPSSGESSVNLAFAAQLLCIRRECSMGCF